VIVDLARHEVADDEVVALEDLMNRRWLVLHATGDRLEVSDVERVRVQTTVPAADIERVVGVGVDSGAYPVRPVAPVLDVHVCRFIAAGAGGLCQQRALWQSQVTFAVGSVFEQLAVPAQIALGRSDVRVRLDAVGAQRLLAHRYPTVGGRPWNDQVVATGHVERTKDRLDLGAAPLDEDALVTYSIAIERTWRVSHDVGDPHIAVAQNKPAAGHRVNAPARRHRQRGRGA
jgi:hypothetical protein